MCNKKIEFMIEHIIWYSSKRIKFPKSTRIIENAPEVNLSDSRSNYNDKITQSAFEKKLCMKLIYSQVYSTL